VSVVERFIAFDDESARAAADLVVGQRVMMMRRPC
jgi:hypothetical protein